MTFGELTAEDVLEGRLYEIRQLVEEYAKAKNTRVHLEHYRKTKRAQLMKRAEQDGFHSVNAQEREAEAHPEYEKLLKNLGYATEDETRAYWKLKLEEWRFEAWKTEQFARNREAARYGN